MKTIIVKIRGEAKDIVRSRSPKKAIERLMKRWPTATFEICDDSTEYAEVD